MNWKMPDLGKYIFKYLFSVLETVQVGQVPVFQSRQDRAFGPFHPIKLDQEQMLSGKA